MKMSDIKINERYYIRHYTDGTVCVGIVIDHSEKDEFIVQTSTGLYSVSAENILKKCNMWPGTSLEQ